MGVIDRDLLCVLTRAAMLSCTHTHGWLQHGFFLFEFKTFRWVLFDFCDQIMDMFRQMLQIQVTEAKEACRLSS